MNSSVSFESRSCGDKFAYDYVFFQADKLVFLALDSRFREDFRRLLERCCGKERFCCKRRLGDTEKYGRNGDGRYVFARCLVFFVTLLVVKKFGLVYYRIRKDLV